jgi:hypothetical protein
MLSLTGLVSLLAIGSESARAATGYTHPTLKGRAALTPRWHSDNPQVTVHGSTCTVEVSHPSSVRGSPRHVDKRRRLGPKADP